ncbi:hypothetical protein ACN38_g10366 [Penicillium nordicum]|uniref:Uncharacterized protein n=1 Tax=Penicillium nordicum TaxID=229535 RepID=A0A0M9WBS0_9EURO|nr:hypothetical protein ACN38_g10366 [Penicillium nordicum]
MDTRIFGDKTPDEVKLERSGKINNLQRYRLTQVWGQIRGDNIKSPFDSATILFIEEDLREVVQEEISIKEGTTLNKDAKERLDALNAKYWFLEQKWWCYHSYLTDGNMLRAFELWRSHPKWYMHRLLVEDCARRHGCCARGCGCCLNRTTDPTRRLGVGHCTFECGCCRRARGFDVSKEDKRDLKEQHRKEIIKLVRHRLTRVALWGLVGDSFENPFDMIDAPPSYGQIVKDRPL